MARLSDDFIEELSEAYAAKLDAYVSDIQNDDSFWQYISLLDLLDDDDRKERRDILHDLGYLSDEQYERAEENDS